MFGPPLSMTRFSWLKKKRLAQSRRVLRLVRTAKNKGPVKGDRFNMKTERGFATNRKKFGQRTKRGGLSVIRPEFKIRFPVGESPGEGGQVYSGDEFPK